VIGILLALFLWNGGAFILKAWFILACALDGMRTFARPISSLAPRCWLPGVALLVLVIEPAHKKG
jgi:hypothetical protein